MKQKTIHTPEYQALLTLLRERRLAAGLSQVEVGKVLREPQPFLSKCERGERRIDLIDLLRILRAIRVPPDDFLQELEERFPVRSDARSIRSIGRPTSARVAVSSGRQRPKATNRTRR